MLFTTCFAANFALCERMFLVSFPPAGGALSWTTGLYSWTASTDLRDLREDEEMRRRSSGLRERRARDESNPQP